MRTCFHCRRELSVGAAVERTAGCPHCHSDLKVCLNCTFHDPGRNNQCREPAAEWVSEKAKANFCEFFSFRDAPAPGRAGGGDADGARAAFDALFRRK